MTDNSREISDPFIIDNAYHHGYNFVIRNHCDNKLSMLYNSKYFDCINKKIASEPENIRYPQIEFLANDCAYLSVMKLIKEFPKETTKVKQELNL